MEKLSLQQINKLGEFVRGVGHDSLDQDFEVHQKQVRNDLVTTVDVGNERKLKSFIQEMRPKANFIGEELSPRDVSLDGEVWMIDPIDGTMNFVKTHDYFGIMLAMYYDGEPVFGMILDVPVDKLVWGQTGDGVWINDEQVKPMHRDRLEDGILLLSAHSLMGLYDQEYPLARRALTIRIYDAASISIIRVIEGKAAGYLAYLKTWDVAAGYAILKELGLPVVTIDGKKIDILNPGQVMFGVNPKEK
ncbi:MAG: inositol monophosphatase family protein [Lactobacillaceae bacterium]|jgi:myo-inositol-1(or 4)-monophosphatase|nr:inositol monophosphatase family protein [Lactobacillaceae bacterium]